MYASLRFITIKNRVARLSVRVIGRVPEPRTHITSLSPPKRVEVIGSSLHHAMPFRQVSGVGPVARKHSRSAWSGAPDRAAVPVLSNGGSRSEHIEALTASSFHLSSLSRNIHALTRLLTQANVQQARAHRDMLDTLEGDVRRHLVFAAGALAALGKPGPSTRSR